MNEPEPIPPEKGYREIVDHASDDDLERYAMRTLPVIEASPLEDHLLICAVCRDRLDETAHYVVAITAAALTLTANSSPERRRQ